MISPRAGIPRVAHVHPSVLPSHFHGVPVAHTLSAGLVSRRSAAGRSFRLDVQAAAKKSVGDLSKSDLEGKTVFVSDLLLNEKAGTLIC